MPSHSPVVYADRYLQWAAFTYKHERMCGHVHTPIHTCGYLYDKKRIPTYCTAVKIMMIIENLKWIACKTQAVIPWSYFSSAAPCFVYVVSKDNDKAWGQVLGCSMGAWSALATGAGLGAHAF